MSGCSFGHISAPRLDTANAARQNALPQSALPKSTYTASLRWSRRPEERFLDGRYSRAHEWAFDGGALVPASSSPHVVRPPFSDPAGVDPEESLVASLAGCHMLFVLDFAGRTRAVLVV